MIRYRYTHIEPNTRAARKLTEAVFDGNKLIAGFAREAAATAYAKHCNKNMGKK